MKKNGFKSGFVTLVGRPNVGKSTLMNHLIGQKIAITSSKPQTTRNRIRTVYTSEEGQIIFVDTPGMLRAKNKLQEYMENAAEGTLGAVDVILWVVEATDFIGGGDRRIADQLRRVKSPVILVMNKIDQKEKQQIPAYLEAYRKLYPSFAEMIPVSALRSVNLDSLREAIFKYLPYGPKYYDDDTVTDQPQRQITAELIREKALRCLEEEIPHGIAVAIDRMTERPDGSMMDIEATIICEKDSHKGIIIGKNGTMLRRIGSQARREIEQMLEMQVNLQLWVKVKKEWRDSDFLIRKFGYDKKDLGDL